MEKKTTTKNVVRIGKHSELLKTTIDPLEYTKKEVQRYNEELKNNQTVDLDFKFDFNEKITYQDDIVSKSKLLNIGYFFLQQIYHDLKIGSFFKSITKDVKIQFDPNQVNRFLTYSLILSPDSKLGTHKSLSDYYEQPDFGYEHILTTLDITYNHYDEYISHLYDASTKIVKRDTSVCFYNCSNYYFETESNDDDYVDAVTG